MASLAEFVGKVWENGEFGVAVAPKEHPECPFDLNKLAIPPEEEEWNRNLVKAHGAIEVLKFKGIDPLGFSPLPKNHKPGNRGSKGITAHGKKLIRNGCWRLEHENKRDVLTFATFTLPDVSTYESIVISQNWGKIQRVFIQKLTRTLRKEGLPGEVVGAVEIQEKRALRDNILAIHLHLVFVGRLPGQTWALAPCEYGELWKTVIQEFLYNEPHAYDWSAVHNVQRVKKSVEGYLGKYASKGVKSLGKMAEKFGESNLPKHWYTCTNSLRDRVLSSRVQLSAGKAKTLVNMCVDFGDVFFVYRKPIEVEFPSGKIVTVGWFGRIKEEYIDMFT